MLPGTEAMWKTLAITAVRDKKLLIGERCYAALGDVSKARYLRNLNDLAENLSSQGTMVRFFF